MDLGGSWLLPKLVGLQQAKRLVLLADTIDAEEARSLGLVTWVKAADEIDAFVDGSGERGSPRARRSRSRRPRRCSTTAPNATLREALANEARAQPGNFATADCNGGVRGVRGEARGRIHRTMGDCVRPDRSQQRCVRP